VLTFETVWSRIVPNSIPVRGAALSASGRVVLWSGSAFLTVMTSASETARIRLPSRIDAVHVSFAGRSDTMLVADSRLGRVLTVTPEGAVVEETVLPLRKHERLLSSHLTPVGERAVLYGAHDSLDASWSLYRITGTKPQLLYSTGRGPGPAFTAGLHVLPTETEILLADQVAPFPILRVSYQGKLLGAFDPVADSLQREIADSGRTPVVVALPVLELDGGFVQVLADLTSSRRVLLRFDIRGRLQKSKVVGGGVGFASSAPNLRRLVAISRDTGLRVTVLSWRWHRLSK
jgi:hypothetical protein